MSVILSLFLLLVILAIFFAIFAVQKNIIKLSIQVKFKKYFIIIYCLFLVISTIILIAIPKNNLISVEKTNSQAEAIPSTDYFKELITNGQLNSSDVYKLKQNTSLKYSNKNLKITNNSNNVTVICKVKDVDDGKIEVENYVTNNSFINGVNISDKIIPSKVTLNNNELTISDDSSFDIKFTKFDYDLTTTQFSKDNPNRRDFLSPFFIMKIMYIQIPKSLQLDEYSIKSLDMIK